VRRSKCKHDDCLVATHDDFLVVAGYDDCLVATRLSCSLVDDVLCVYEDEMKDVCV